MYLNQTAISCLGICQGKILSFQKISKWVHTGTPSTLTTYLGNSLEKMGWCLREEGGPAASPQPHQSWPEPP